MHSIQISASRSEPIVIKCREVFSQGACVCGKAGNVQLDCNASRKGQRGSQSATSGVFPGFVAGRWGESPPGRACHVYLALVAHHGAAADRVLQEPDEHMYAHPTPTHTDTHLPHAPPKLMAGRLGHCWYRVTHRTRPQFRGTGTEPPGHSAKRRVPRPPMPGGDGPGRAPGGPLRKGVRHVPGLRSCDRTALPGFL